MLAESTPLYGRLEDFSLDAIDAQLSFSCRLARENGWSINTALRVIEEYKKFAYLAVIAGHPVTPSDQVDQVWHLHLTYSRSYWEDFCPNVLQMPLHHEPTQGGESEQTKFQDWYGKTLSSYEVAFGQKPPADIWPPPTIRFGQNGQFVRVNRSRNWILPKLNEQGLKTRLIVTSVSLLLLTGCQTIGSVSNPFNSSGSAFLLFYSVIAGTALVIAIAWQQLSIKLKYGQLSENDLSLYDIAHLSGEKRLADTVIISLQEKGYITLASSETEDGDEVTSQRKTLEIVKAIDENCHPLETLMMTALPGLERFSQIRASVDSAKAIIQERLQHQGLLMCAEQVWAIQRIPVLLLTAILGCGGVKIVIGLIHEKPTGYLSTLCLLLIFLGWLTVWYPISAKRRSPAGDRLLENLRLQYPLSSTSKIPTDNLAYHFALFGTAALADDQYADLRLFLEPPLILGTNFSDNASYGDYTDYGTFGDVSGGGGSDSSCGGCGGCGGGD
jgi:uncharacterized protein (TIGR04222 family)